MFRPIEDKSQLLVRIFPSIEAIDANIREALTRLASVQFVGCADVAECRTGDTVIHLQPSEAVMAQLARAGVNSFNILTGVSPIAAGEKNASIQFSNSSYLDSSVRGRILDHQPLPERFPLKAREGDEVLASVEGDPIWLVNRRHGCQTLQVSIPMLKLKAEEVAGRFLTGDNFLRLLPLAHFLRDLKGGSQWQRLPPMACIMIDDPNLHMMSYGHLDFKNLLERSRAMGIHVAFATVPLDAWGANAQAAQLFRENRRYFSLLYHGNDHIKRELARRRTREAWLASFAQGLTRIARLEKKTGLAVARVMAAPHESYSEPAAQALASLGFKGACISMSSLYHWNNGRKIRPAFGLDIAEWLDGCLPILHRFNISSFFRKGDIAISAFLRRPIIAVGHQELMADGGRALEQTVAAINSTGEVAWGEPSQMLQRSYLLSRQDDCLSVMPYSTQIRFSVPNGINRVSVIRPNLPGMAEEFTATIGNGNPPKPLSFQPPGGTTVEAQPGQEIEICLAPPGQLDYHTIKVPGLSWPAFLRRIACEGRDRLSPIAAKLTHRGAL